MENEKVIKDDGTVLEFLMENENSFFFKEEMDAYENFINSKDRVVFDKNTFGERVGMKKSALKNMFTPFIFKERIIKFYKVKEFDIILINKDENSYKKYRLELPEYVYYFEQNDSNYIGNGSKSIFIFKYVCNKASEKANDFFMYKSHIDMVVEDYKLMFIRKDFQMVIEDLSIITGTGTKSSKSIFFNDFVLFAAQHIGNNPKNKRIVLRIMAKDGINSEVMTLTKMQFTEKSIRKYMFPKLKWGSYDAEYVARAAVAIIETQDCVNEKMVIDIMNAMSQNKHFLRILKNNRKIKKKFSDNPGILLLIAIN